MTVNYQNFRSLAQHTGKSLVIEMTFENAVFLLRFAL